MPASLRGGPAGPPDTNILSSRTSVRYTPGPMALPRPAVIQPSFEDLGTPLAAVTFVVVDLETTGGAPGRDGITEVGAVKYRGGECLGTFQTLVNPGVPIPPTITV